MGREHSIFISYARKDRARAEMFARTLEARGWPVWWDPHIPPGETFDRVIKAALDKAKAVIVLWSRASVESDWVLGEADEARQREVLVPVLIERVEVPIVFRRVQAADLMAWSGDPGHPELVKLFRKIEALAGPPCGEKGEGVPPIWSHWDRWRAALRRPRVRIALGAALAVVLAGAAYGGWRWYEDVRFAGLIAEAEAQTAANKFAAAEKILDRAARLRPDDARLMGARQKWSAAWRIHRSQRHIQGGLLPIQDCPVCPKLAEIPAGTLTMGSPESEKPRYADEGPQRAVRIVRPFLIGRYEVTLAEFRAFVRKSGHKPAAGCATFNEGEGWNPTRPNPNLNWEWPDLPSYGDEHPVVCVSWHDAKAYVAWLSSETGKRYRLPSEAEWEWAARGEGEGPHYWPGGEAAACDYANVADSTTIGHSLPRNWRRFKCSDGFAWTAPVGRKPPNQHGLHDMLGNVWEWVEDCYHPSYRGAPDGQDPWTTGDCELRVMRGGSWMSQIQDVRIAMRGKNLATVGFYSAGFRVLREKD